MRIFRSSCFILFFLRAQSLTFRYIIIQIINAKYFHSTLDADIVYFLCLFAFPYLNKCRWKYVKWNEESRSRAVPSSHTLGLCHTIATTSSRDLWAAQTSFWMQNAKLSPFFFYCVISFLVLFLWEIETPIKSLIL